MKKKCMLRLTVFSSAVVFAYANSGVQAAHAEEGTLSALINEAHAPRQSNPPAHIDRSEPVQLTYRGNPDLDDTEEPAPLAYIRYIPVHRYSAGPTDPNVPSLPYSEIDEKPTIASVVDLTVPSEDLWERIRKGYSMPDLQSELVLQQQQHYMNNPDYLRRVVERSRRYIYHILDQIESRGMPTELALLPIVESAYNPMAESRAKAVGLWQFIPSTGKNFNLEQNWWVDQRRDIIASTNAALDYLGTVYEMHSDWHLALASYNWGENAVARAIAKNEAQGLRTDYASLSMPQETRLYVPKLQALKNIFGNKHLLAQLDIPETPNRPYFVTVSAPGNIDIRMAAKLADMPIEEFKALNPAHKRPVINGDSDLVIPHDKIKIFKANLDRHAPSLSKWEPYTLQRGDNLNKLAARYGTDVALLKEVNGIGKKTRLKPGSVLLIPTTKGTIHTAAWTQETSPAPASSTPAKVSANKPIKSVRTQHYRVQKGDTLTAIGRRFGISVTEIKRWNALRANRIVPGQLLAVTEQKQGKTTTIALRTPKGKSTSGSSRSDNTKDNPRYAANN